LAIKIIVDVASHLQKTSLKSFDLLGAALMRDAPGAIRGFLNPALMQ